MRIYFDTCCLGRYFDDPTERTARELAAIERVMERVERGEWTWISSEVLGIEIRCCTDHLRRLDGLARIGSYSTRFAVDPGVRARAAGLQATGLGAFDAAHLAVAERAAVDVFLTTDDNLIKRSRAAFRKVEILVARPDVWISSMERST